MSIAFQGQISVREGALGRLAEYTKTKRLQNGALQWDGSEGSLAGVLATSSEAADWESRLGLPKWLAYAVDTLSGRLGPNSLDLVTDILKAAPVGKDIEGAGSLVVCKLLDEAAAVMPPEGELTVALDEILRLHQRAAAGASAPAAAWREARRAAVRATDALVPEPAEGQRLDAEAGKKRGVGLTIESAAWDPRQSPMAVSEVLRQWLNLEGQKSDGVFGWTPEDDALIRSRLDEMHAKHLANNPDDKRTVFDHLEIDHPDTATRLKAYIKHGRDHGVVCTERACRLVRDVLENLR